MKNQLAFIERDDVFTNTLIIAVESGNEHESVVALLKKYWADFEESGKICFTDLKSGNRGRPTRVYNLNEEQAVLLITYLDNTTEVRRFEKELVRQFTAMRRFLLEKQTADWCEIRAQGKQARLQATDAIKMLEEYAMRQGSTHPDKLYLTYTKLINQLTGCAGRDASTVDMLMAVQTLERLLPGLIFQGMQEALPYKAIYQQAKAQMTAIMALWNMPRMIA